MNRATGRLAPAIAALAGVLAAAACGQAGPTGTTPPPNATAADTTPSPTTTTGSAHAVGQTVTIAPVKGGDWYTTISDPAHGRAYATWSVAGSGTDTRVYVAASADGGATWGAPVWIARDQAAWMSNVRVDGNGRLWVEYTHFDLDPKHLLKPSDKYSNPAWIRVAYSDDGGATFSAPIDTVAKTGSYSVAFGSIGVSADGRTVTASWLDYNPLMKPVGRDAAPLLAATSTNGGRTFGRPVTVAQTACVCCMPYSFDAGTGNAVLFRGWQAGMAMGDVRDIEISSRGADNVWTLPVKVHDDHFMMDMCPSVGPSAVRTPDGALHVAYWTGATAGPGYYLARSTDGGATFETPLLIEKHPAGPNENPTTLAYDSTGTAWTATVGHGQYDPKGNEDVTPNAITVYTVGADQRPIAVPGAAAPGMHPQLATVPGGILETWVADGKLLARRIGA